jgi:glutaryl-CoA dehydrogenase (non-decarboxylating)
MIDFELTDEQKMVAKMVKDLSAREFAPQITEWDEKAQWQPVIAEKLSAQGIMGLCTPEKYGGSGFDYISLGLACEELEYVDTALRVTLSVHIGLAQMPILTWGSEDIRQRYLPQLASGEKIGAFGLTEPNAGTDVIALETKAVKDGNDWLLSGEKMWISLSDIADVFVIIAWTDLEKMKKRDHSGVSAFVLERGMKGLSTASIHGKLGVRAGNTGSISMDQVRVPQENMLGLEGEGFKIAMFCLDQGRYTVGWGATGLIKACLDASTTYANSRVTFGKTIGHHQLVKSMIAKMKRNYEASKLLNLKAGWLKNQGKRCTKETALAKWYACDASEVAASDCVQVHGAYGYSNEFPAERFYRNAKGALIYEGSREVQQLITADYELGLRNDKPLRKSMPPHPFPKDWE